MNFIRNRNFRAGPQTSLEGFICPQNSDKQQKIKVFGRSGGANLCDLTPAVGGNILLLLLYAFFGVGFPLLFMWGFRKGKKTIQIILNNTALN